VIACYELDGNALDGSSHHLDATTTHVAFQAGVVGDALQLAADSAVDAPDRPALDVDAVTIEAWVFASQLPADPSSAFILDVDQQYAMFARRGGDFGCSFVGGPDVTAIGRVPARAWHHVACTYDGNTSVIYVDGEQANSAKGGNALGKAGKTGLSLGGSNPSGTGGRFIGLIDEVRLTDEARTAQQICTDAGEFSCL
jgi:hypothetical protein